MERPHVACLLLHRRHIAEAAARAPVRLVRAPAFVAIVPFAHREMERQLLVEVALEAIAADERQHAPNECLHAVFMTRVTAPATRVQ